MDEYCWFQQWEASTTKFCKSKSPKLFREIAEIKRVYYIHSVIFSLAFKFSLIMNILCSNVVFALNIYHMQYKQTSQSNYIAAPLGVKRNACKKNQEKDYTMLLCAVLNESWKHHPPKQQLFDHQSPITQVGQTNQSRPYS